MSHHIDALLFGDHAAMDKAKYIISYRSIPNVERSTRRTMEHYIKDEEIVWNKFFSRIVSYSNDLTFSPYNTEINFNQLTSSFSQLRNVLDDTTKFSAINSHSIRRTTVVPPPSRTIEGQLILGLCANDRLEDAVAAYVRFIVDELGGSQSAKVGDRTYIRQFQRGETLLAAAYVSAALPFHEPTASSLKVTMAKAQDLLASLDSVVGEAERVNIDHESKLGELRTSIAKRAVRLRGILLRSERRRGQNFLNWQDEVKDKIRADVQNTLNDIRVIGKEFSDNLYKRQAEFNELESLYHTQLRFRAPVALWGERALMHRKQANAAQARFWCAVSCAVIVAIAVPYWLGDYIAGSFKVLHCLQYEPKNCTLEFSIKGPLTVASLLLTMSLILWVTRMQYRIFLSERHLSLDADEKKAFAETFMALKEGANVDVANETIVLASLFRPTQDGIIKDESGSFDISTVTMLAKQLAK